jgi:hypothetical protein
LKFGPDNATLTVRTGKAGAASKAGHNLRMEVTSWSAALELGEQPSLQLSADSRSFRVIEGSGGVMPLGDEEKAAIPQTIEEEVLKGAPIEFHSTRVDVNGKHADVQGELDIFGARRPVAFTLELDDRSVRGSVRIKQSDWGVKPYSALFGTLKVADEVDIEVDARSADDG